MPPVTYGPIGPAHQRGVVSVLTASLLVLLLTLLALVVDTGRLYLEQRNLQKVADMAALDASARLPKGYCAGKPALAEQFALESASLHGFTVSEESDETTLTTQCVTLASQAGMRQVAPNASSGAGVQVIVEQETPASLLLRGGALFSDAFSGTVSLSANASAQRSDAVAAFTVGSQLLRLNNDKLLGQLLEGVGLDVSLLTVLDANGIANASVTPAGLLRELGVDVGINELALLSPSGLIELVDTQVDLLGIEQLINASLSAVSDNVLSASLRTALSDLSEEVDQNEILKSVDLNLFSIDGEGLIQLAAGSLNSTRAALETNINLGELLSVALLTGTSQHAVELPRLELPGIIIAASAIEPPTLAIGPVGTIAHSAQVRLHIDVDTNRIIGEGLGRLLRVHLPITVEVAGADAELMALQCQTTPHTADIKVAPQPLNICLGEMDNGALQTPGTLSCSQTTETSVLTLLGIELGAGLSKNLGTISLTGESGQLVEDLEVGESAVVSSELELGTAIGNITTGLLSNVGNLLSQGGEQQNLEVRRIATQYLEASKNGPRYDPDAAANLVLFGKNDNTGNSILEPITRENWPVNDYKYCVFCSPSAPFRQAFVDMTNSGGLLGTGLLPNIRSPYEACGGLLKGLGDLLANHEPYNSCAVNNLTNLLERKPGGLNLSSPHDDFDFQNPQCSGLICIVLKPVLNTVGSLLNGLSGLLAEIVSDSLGLELGNTEVRVESISCGVPTLVQ